MKGYLTPGYIEAVAKIEREHPGKIAGWAKQFTMSTNNSPAGPGGMTREGPAMKQRLKLIARLNARKVEREAAFSTLLSGLIKRNNLNQNEVRKNTPDGSSL